MSVIVILSKHFSFVWFFDRWSQLTTTWEFNIQKVLPWPVEHHKMWTSIYSVFKVYTIQCWGFSLYGIRYERQKTPNNNPAPNVRHLESGFETRWLNNTGSPKIRAWQLVLEVARNIFALFKTLGNKSFVTEQFSDGWKRHDVLQHWVQLTSHCFQVISSNHNA